ncbi:MAG: hypothetical protein U0704_13280 [Candidatus Eisenbacteria bacterium]
MFELRPVADSAVRSQLVELCAGSKPLTARLARWMASGAGTLSAYVPVESLPDLPASLGTGGLTDEASQAAGLSELESHAAQFIGASEHRFVMLESQAADPTDPFLTRHIGEWRAIRESCYFITRRLGQGPDSDDLYAGSCHWLDAWFFCTGDRILGALEAGLADESPGDLLIESVWISAYDAEGFIVWSPESKP